MISNQRPNSAVEFEHTKDSKKKTIHFDADGVCDACRVAEQKHGTIDWDERDRQLRELCDRYRRNDGSYDCLVPGSGGKDSFYAAHVLKHQVRHAPAHGDVGAAHLHRVGLEELPGVDPRRLRQLPAHAERPHAPAADAACGREPVPSVPGRSSSARRALAPKMALLHDIPLVFYGENEAEYGNPHQPTRETAKRDWTLLHRRRQVDRSILGGVVGRTT